MKLLSCLLPAAASFACLCSPLPAPAQAPAPANFGAVAKHLETGGVFYTVVDIDGDLAKFAGIGDGLLDLAKQEAGGALPPGLSATGIMKSLGLDRLKAIGMSSKPAAGNLFHNRALLYMPEGRSGIFKLMGGASGPLQSLALAPAGSDVVMEAELTLSALLEIAEALLRSTGDEAMLQQYRGMLGFPMPGGLEMTAGDFIAKLDTRIIIAGRLEKDKSFTPPGEKFTLPGFRLVISFDKLDFLAAPLMTYAKYSAEMTVERGDGYELIKPKALPPETPAFLQPLFYHDLKSKRLLLATHPEALQEFLAGKTPLSGDPVFVKAMAGLPAEANEMSYLTPAVSEAFQQFIGEVLKAAPPALRGPDNEDFKKILDLFQEIAPMPTQPMVEMRTNLPEGMLFLSNSTNSFKSSLIIPPAFVAVSLAAGALAGYREVMPKVRANYERSQADREEEEPVEDDDANQAVRNNLQQIAFAAQSFFVDRPNAAEVTYEQLLDAELLFKLDPVSGESYQGLKLQKSGGTLTLKLPGGGTLTQKYGPATD